LTARLGAWRAVCATAWLEDLVMGATFSLSSPWSAGAGKGGIPRGACGWPGPVWLVQVWHRNCHDPIRPRCVVGCGDGARLGASLNAVGNP
jgi:hypothetical protein